MIPRHRPTEDIVPAAPKEMVEKIVTAVLVRFENGGIDEVLCEEDGDSIVWEIPDTDPLHRPVGLELSIRGVRYSINLTKACYWTVESKRVLVEKAPFKPGSIVKN